ncbi:MAG: peptide chain release factor N(5)-glutamine methyltransferase [Pseudomonadota bacterium]
MTGFFAAGRWWDVTQDESEQIKHASDRLAGAGIENALNDARLLWSAALPRRFENHTDVTDGGVLDRFDALVARRAAREPLSHLVGYRDFYKHRFVVTPDVLDPRPDTETLVEVAGSEPFKRVLDLGTGSGCILLSLLAEQTDALGVGTDLSHAALKVAAQNVARLELDHRVELLRSDWYDVVSGTFDLIVSNPPYIAAVEMPALQPEVRDYEPRLALTDGADGLSCYRDIVAGASRHLVPNGRLAVEIGPTQAAVVTELLHAQGFAETRVTQDLDGRDRVVSARYPAK